MLYNKIMVKNIILAILLCAAVMGWGMAVYQNKLQEDSRQQLENSIMEQVDHYWKTRISIRDQVDSSEKARNFITQQEQLRELQDALSKKVDDFHQENLDNVTRMEQAFNQSLEGVSARGLEYEKQLSNVTARLDDSAKGQKGYEDRLSEYQSRLSGFERESQDSLKQLEAGLKQELALVKERQDGSAARLQELTNKLEQYISGQEKGNKQLEQIKQQLEELKNQQPAVSTPTK